MVDEFVGLKTRDVVRGTLVSTGLQFCPPSVLLKIAWLGPTVAAYNMLEFFGSMENVETSCLNPLAVQLTPPSMLLVRLLNWRAYIVVGVVGSIARGDVK